MRQLFLTLLTAALSLTTAAQTPQPKAWLKSRQWAGAFTAAKPHKTVDAAQFYTQYHRNTAQWQQLFQWLSTTDLRAIGKGKHPIPGSTLVASVEDSENAPLPERNTESHRKKIDFQLVVDGVEGFALLDHATSTVARPYDEQKDVVRYNYQPRQAHFFNVRGGQFVIFFPSDWHIAKVQTRKNNQKIRVIVVKMDYVE